jgi:SAM-dependent methyltransferase
VTDSESTAADRRWLAATWPFVRRHVPPPPRRVLDVGCGPLGGFVPALRTEGYDADGIDPQAPDGPNYHQIEFEAYAGTHPAGAIVASTSLHHVADLDAVVHLIARRLEPDGVLVVMEWARERFDEATARWCFDRLADEEPGWLHRHRDHWLASGDAWDAYLDGWAASEGLYTGDDILRALAVRFDIRQLARGPYFFPDLSGVTAADEQTAIDAGTIQANGIRYVGRPLTDTR